MFWIWLLLILPWLVLVWMSLRMRSGATTWVSAAFLWPIERASAGGPSRRRPPAWAIVALVSLLLGIIAISDFTFLRSKPGVTLIINLATSMTPEQIEQASRIVRDVTDVRDEVTIDQSKLFVEVRKTLNQFDGPVVIVSDREMIRDPRVTTMVPSQNKKNIGISHASAVLDHDNSHEDSAAMSNLALPSASLFMTILNDSQTGEVDVRITCGDFVSEQKVQVPTRSNNVLVTFEPRDLTVLVQLRPAVGSDEISSDDVMVLRAEPLVRRFEVADELRGDVELMKLVESYGRARPRVSVGGLAGEAVRIVRAKSDVKVSDTDRTIFLKKGDAGAGVSGPVEWVGGGSDGPVDMFFPSDTVSSNVPGSGWQILARRDGESVIGTRGKSVWVGVDSPTLRKSATWVVLLASAMDHASGYPMRFVMSPEHQNVFLRPSATITTVTTRDELIKRLGQLAAGTTHRGSSARPADMSIQVRILLIACVIGLSAGALMCYSANHAA